MGATGVALHRLSRSDDAVIHHQWDHTLPPALTIDPGDEVEIETRTGDDGQFTRKSTAADLATFDRSRLHALSGPIFMRGADPGDTLVVHIRLIATGDWGFTMQREGAGFLPGFGSWLRTWRLDRAPP